MGHDHSHGYDPGHRICAEVKRRLHTRFQIEHASVEVEGAVCGDVRQGRGP